MMKQFMVVTYAHILMKMKTKIKRAENPGSCHFTVTVFVIWITFICKDLHCDVKFKWTKKKKERKKKLCAETTIHNINVLQWFDSF